MIPKLCSKAVKVEYGEGFEISCIVDDWDFGEYNPTWHFHMINIHPEMVVEEGEKQP